MMQNYGQMGRGMGLVSPLVLAPAHSRSRGIGQILIKVRVTIRRCQVSEFLAFSHITS